MTGIRIESFPSSALTRGTSGFAGMPDRGVTIASNHPSVLMDIHRPGVNLAIWHRPLLAPLLGKALQGLMPAAPFTVVAVGSSAELPDRLAEQLPGPVPTDLMLDLVNLVAGFLMLDGGGSRARVRLEALVHDGCRKWHADAVGLRMLCTYCGAGTQWLPINGGAAAARALNGATPSCGTGQLPTGAIAVLKGERYPNNEGNGCIHRSPPAGPGPRARLLLCIDQTEWNLEE